MKHPRKVAVFVLSLGLLLCLARAGSAQGGRTPAQPRLVTAARVAAPAGAFSGPLFITVGGEERQVADEAIKAWVIQGGRKVVYSGRDGAGGYENEGQSLRAYDASTGASRKIMSAYYMVDGVTEVTTRAGRTALLVEMSDGGLGASYVAVVDPARGEVFFRRWARVVSRRGDTVVLGHYREDDWERLNAGGNARVRPHRTERLNLNSVLRRRVIVNRPGR
jgi:hypothetical protein